MGGKKKEEKRVFGVFVKVQLILLTMKIIWIRITMKAEETSEYWEIFDF